MPITINGTGTITGLSAGGLPDASVTLPDLAASVASGVAKAWVNFNGSGTVAIRSSLNVSSITDNAVGDYSINFATAMADTNYAAAGFGVAYGTADTRATMVAYRATGTASYVPSNKATGSARILTGLSNATGQADVTDISFIVFA